MKKFQISIILLIVIISSNCFKKEQNYIFEKYKKPERNIFEIMNKKIGFEEFYNQNLINMKNGYPFYIIRLDAPLLFKKPENSINVPDDYVLLKFGDIVFPVQEQVQTKNYFHVKTIDNKYGWIYSGFGISLNYNEVADLYFFSEEHYLTDYKNANGNIDNSSKIVLIKNIVPMLLANYTSKGWFYPNDYNLALQLSKYAVSIAENKKTYFFSASSLFDWSVNELVTSYNMLADTYQKLKFFDKAEEIHKFLNRMYFGQSADNCPIGGLNSIIKLEKIYLEELTYEKKGTRKYKEIEDKLIDDIVRVGDDLNIFTMIDKKWRLTTPEWAVDILRHSLKKEDFYDIAKKLIDKTTSIGFADMVNLYVGLELINEGKNEDGLKILAEIKPRDNTRTTLRISDWLSANKIIPDSIIYQYNL